MKGNRRRAFCNLYSITTNQAAIIAPFRVVNLYVGNLAPLPGVFSGSLQRPLPDDALRTLRQTALEVLLLVAERDGPEIMAWIGMLQALNRHSAIGEPPPRRKRANAYRIVR